jgi:7-cyano-7-deazaguanine synthase
MDKQSALCILSGGMDSTTLLYHLLFKLNDVGHVEAISFDYGQRHRKELDYAQITCARWNVPHKIVYLPGVAQLLGGSALTDDIDVPEGHYEDKSMKITVVPNRNMIMLSLAGAYAVSRKFNLLATAVHAGDHAIYPDCRPEFIQVAETALQLGNYFQVSIYAPYLQYTKTDIALEGLTLGIDYDRDTWSCYKGGIEPCGKCGTCVERIEALSKARQSGRVKPSVRHKQKVANEQEE